MPRSQDVIKSLILALRHFHPQTAAENGKIRNMQGLILAAGMGKRLKELTQDNTKCMVKVNGVRLIERALDWMLGLGREIVGA